MRIALLGYGKMGKAIEAIAQSRGHETNFRFGASDSLTTLKKEEVDIAIEFTQPASAFKNIQYCLEEGIPVISGTTGWLAKLEEIQELCKEKNGTFLYASNFSIGVNLFFELNEWLAKKMAALNFEPEITEAHHTEKKDSPSGTAITLAEGILKFSQEKQGWINDKSADHKKITILSERIPNVPGTHSVSYSSPLESIEIKHTVHTRTVFAEGVIKVAEWIQTRKGVFTMSDFINDN